MNRSDFSTQNLGLASWIWIRPIAPASTSTATADLSSKRVDLLYPLRHWLNRTPIDSPKLAHRLCRLIPAQCPFERDIHVLGHHFHIPPLCKLNPLYEEVVGLRFRALCYLADECGEDVAPYC